MFGQAMNPIIRADGNPRFAMISTLVGAAINIILTQFYLHSLVVIYYIITLIEFQDLIDKA